MNALSDYLWTLDARLRATVNRLVRARDGVAAVEFALLLPVFALIYLMSFQLTVAFSVANNASRAASTISDIVTQAQTTNTTALSDMYSLAEAMMTPYSMDDFAVKVTGIKVDANSDAKVAWSWENDGAAPYAAASTIDIPTDLKQAGAFLVHAEVVGNFNYTSFGSKLLSSEATTINIKRDFYFRQRVGAGITCSDCPV